jgi:molybdopterin molybdotransferase
MEDLLARQKAVTRVLDLHSTVLERQQTEVIPLDRMPDRFLGEAITADDDLPPHSHATMDGFAFDATDEYPLQVVGEVFPEEEPPKIEAGEAVRVATGAPLPERANTVLKREEATVKNGRLRGADLDPGMYTYQRGSNVEAGEMLFEANERLAPKDAILLRDVGIEEVVVREPFSVGILATGTEIHEGRSADLDSPMLAGLVQAWNHEAIYEGTVPDEYSRVEERIAAVAADHDVVFTTGGTSVGEKDYAVRALKSIGEVLFHGVRIRPGKPIAAAILSDHDAVAFAIPGKPIGAHTIATAIVRPFFTGDASLPTIEAELLRNIDIGVEGFEYWVPVLLNTDEATDTEAMPLGHIDSPLSVYEETFDPSVLSSSTRAAVADGFFVTEEGVRAGDPIQVVPYAAIE